MKQKLAHYHFNIKRVLAVSGRNVARDKSAYIQRTRERDMPERQPVLDAASYMMRLAQKEEQRKAEVACTALILPDGVSMTREDLWDGMDRAARGKNGDYRRHGGHMPGLALFGNASIPYGVGEADAIEATESFAYWLVEEFGCAVEIALHRKQGKVDHAHFLIPDRVISPDGIGKKIRAFNGLSDLMAGTGLEVEEGRQVAPALEAMRARWANEMRAASGNPDIDHRSFARRGLNLKPVPNVDRKRIDKEARRGKSWWRDERDAIILPRNAAFFSLTEAPTPHSGPSPDISPTPSLADNLISAAGLVRATAEAIVLAAPLPNLSFSAFEHLPPSDTGRLKLLLERHNASQDPAVRASLLEDIKRETADIQRRAYAARRALEEKAAQERISRLAQIAGQKFAIGAEQPGPYFGIYAPQVKDEVTSPVRPTIKPTPTNAAQTRPAEPTGPAVPPRAVNPQRAPADRPLHSAAPVSSGANHTRPSMRERVEDEVVDLRDAFAAGGLSMPGLGRSNSATLAPSVSPQPQQDAPTSAASPSELSIPLSSSPRKVQGVTPPKSSPVPRPEGINSRSGDGSTPFSEPVAPPSIGDPTVTVDPKPRPAQPICPPQRPIVRPASSVSSPQASSVSLLDVAIKLGTAYYHQRAIPKKSQSALAGLVNLTYDEFELKMRAMREDIFIRQQMPPQKVVEIALKEARDNHYGAIIDIHCGIVEKLAQSPPRVPIRRRPDTPGLG